ncbi:MAG: restriction endonuclease [Elusimicrobia bacterium]|nr:restriction endonuclease [Elusimicrobiota bacterium]
MNINFPIFQETRYKSASQIARVVTERWAAGNLYCPACPSEHVVKQPENTEAVDFICSDCSAAFQLKASRQPFGEKVMDAGYEAMRRALERDNFPHLFLLHYDWNFRRVSDLSLIPSYFLSLSAIEARKPLGPGARRAGWIGCNIVLSYVPPDGRIPVIASGAPIARTIVRNRFAATRAMGTVVSLERGWTLDLLTALRSLGSEEFSLGEAYTFEGRLSALHPNNRHVRPKIRQQLQVLRDLGFVTFLGGGRYHLKSI